MTTSSIERRRRASRGAALVESLIAIPAMTLILGGMLFLHRMISTSESAMAEARFTAWNDAMNACGGDGQGANGILDLQNQMHGASGSKQSLLDPIPTSSHETGSRQVELSLAGGPTDRQSVLFSQSVSAHASVMCNTTTTSGHLRDVLYWVIREVNPAAVWNEVRGKHGSGK
jgi:hypothetical protein